MILLLFFILLSIVCFSIVLVGLLQYERASVFTHACVAITFLPISGILSFVLPLVYNNAVDFVHKVLAPMSGLGFLASVPKVDEQASFLDAQAIACLLLCEYGFMVVSSHLVDLTRYLKISRRRIRYHQQRGE